MRRRSQLRLLDGGLRLAQIKARIGQPKMRFAVVWFPLQSSLEVRFRRLGWCRS